MTVEIVLFLAALALFAIVLAMLSSRRFGIWFGNTFSMPIGRRFIPGVRRFEEINKETESRGRILDETIERAKAKQEADPNADLSVDVTEIRRLMDLQFEDLQEMSRLANRYRAIGLVFIVAGAVLFTIIAVQLFAGD